MGMTKPTEHEQIGMLFKIADRQSERSDLLFGKIEVLENQVRDLQTLVINLKMYPPAQYVSVPQLVPPPVVPYNPLPGYPFPYSITYAPNSSSGKIP